MIIVPFLLRLVVPCSMDVGVGGGGPPSLHHGTWHVRLEGGCELGSLASLVGSLTMVGAQ